MVGKLFSLGKPNQGGRAALEGVRSPLMDHRDRGQRRLMLLDYFEFAVALMDVDAVQSVRSTVASLSTYSCQADVVHRACWW